VLLAHESLRGLRFNVRDDTGNKLTSRGVNHPSEKVEDCELYDALVAKAFPEAKTRAFRRGEGTANDLQGKRRADLEKALFLVTKC
jgi:hypothetical protein